MVNVMFPFVGNISYRKEEICSFSICFLGPRVQNDSWHLLSTEITQLAYETNQTLHKTCCQKFMWFWILMNKSALITVLKQMQSVKENKFS